MNLQTLIHAVYHEPALITPDAHASIRQLLESRLDLLPTLFAPSAAQREGQDFCGDKVLLPSMEIIEGIAVIPVSGVVGCKLSGFAKGRGAVDVADIRKDLDEAEANVDVRGILLDIDSPGGMVAGTPELATRIAATTKTTYAFSDGLICSAAYWLASSCDGIFATQTASIGSIGVYVPWIDVSKAYEAAGYKVDIIKTGEFKGAGFPGTSLSEAQRAHLQARVDEIFALFAGHVESSRAGVSRDSMQGQSFLTDSAVRAGLVDARVLNRAEVLSLFDSAD